MMLRIAITLAAFVLALPGAELAVEQGTVSPDKPAALAVKLIAGTEAPTGFQFDVEFDAAALELTVEAGPVTKQANKGLQFRQLQPGKIRVLIIGFNRTAIADGVLALIHVADKAAQPGKTFPVHLTGASGTNADAKSVEVTAKDGSVTVEK
jgi:Cohesin domain